MQVHLSGSCSALFWGDTMNKLPYFLVALCLCMFCSFSAYADDTPPADSPPDTTPVEDTLSNSSVQVSDPALYAKLDTLQESIDKLADALTPAAEGDTPAEDTAAPDYTNQLSTISGQLLELQEAVTATPETAKEPNIWDKPFNDYTPQEGYALLTFILVLSACVFVIFRRF